MIVMSQEVNEKQKVSENNQPYATTATAKRFSSTNEYTDQYITHSKNHRSARFTFFD